MLLRKILSYVILITVVGISMVTSCHIEVVDSYGETITLEMDYKDFQKVQAGYGFDIEISKANSYSVILSLDETLVQYLSIKKSGSTVYINLKSNCRYMNQVRKAVITMPDLRRLELSGGSDGIVTGFSTTQDVDFQASGASSLDIRNLKTGNTDFNLSGDSQAYGSIKISDGNFNLSGGSKLELQGSASDISLEASGSSDAKLKDFPCLKADVRLSGGSTANIHVSSRLDINLSGSSELTYAGEPKLGNFEVSGNSRINQE